MYMIAVWIDIVLFAGIVGLSLVSIRLKALTINGAISAIAAGTLILLGARLAGLILLGIFFVTSTFWSKWRQKEKMAVEEIVAKGDTRDYAQVLANGGVPALFSLLYLVTDNPLALLAFAVSLASANADTWASEIGVLSSRDPVLLFSRKKVPKGTSGAVSALGTFAGLSGSFTIALASFIVWPEIVRINGILWITFWGFINMFLDTIIGQTLQEKLQCKVCEIITEKKHHCGEKTVYLQGIHHFNNDWVNFFSIFITSLISFVFSFIFANSFG